METQNQVVLSNANVKSYQTLDADTGEVKNKIKYLPGAPKSYRFDAKEGKFNINGTEKLGDSFTFQPIAWRIFTDDILQLGKKEWAEIFFVDDKNCVSALMFHGWSVANLMKQIEPLYYDELTLADVVLTVTAEKKENTKISPKGVYYIAEFSYKIADKEKVKMYGEYVADTKIYRSETLTDTAEVRAIFGFSTPGSVLGIDDKGGLVQNQG